jgi:imidazolonepropionase-like amidohydrolase
MTRVRFILWLTASLMCLPACGDTHAPPQAGPDEPAAVIALAHGSLVDGTGASAIPNALLIIEQGRITSAGAFEAAAVPPEADLIDVSGCTLLPGFINAHVHGAYDEATLRAWAQGGVTTVRDLGANPSRPLFAIRDSLAAISACARLIAAGPLMTVPGGYPMVPWGSSAGLPVTSPEDAQAKAMQLLDAGADLLKIALEGGASFDRVIPMLSQEEAQAIVSVAHARQTRVSAHVLVAADLAKAIDAGVDDVAHMVWDSLPDSLIERMTQAGIAWVPTLELWHGVSSGTGRAAIANLARFVAAGGEVALGTDYAGYECPFDLGMTVREVHFMEAAGMTPMEIIVAATRNAARVCNREEDLGTLEADKIADVLVVTGDPLQDLNALEHVRMIVKDGVVIRSQ